jgi:hypothetical protein
MRLSDGLSVSGDRLRGVLNRLVLVPFDAPYRAHPADREYAAHELTAFFGSWLYSLTCPVLNRPSPPALSGAVRHPSEWMVLARRAGFRTACYREASSGAVKSAADERPRATADSSTRTLFVVNGEAIGEPPTSGLACSCRALAGLSRAELLGVELTTDAAGAWIFAGASPLPDLRGGGDALADALGAALAGRRDRS